MMQSTFSRTGMATYDKQEEHSQRKRKKMNRTTVREKINTKSTEEGAGMFCTEKFLDKLNKGIECVFFWKYKYRLISS